MTNQPIDLNAINNAIHLITTMRDRALNIEDSIRMTDPAATFREAWGIMLDDLADDFSPDAIDLAVGLIKESID